MAKQARERAFWWSFWSTIRAPNPSLMMETEPPSSCPISYGHGRNTWTKYARAPLLFDPPTLSHEARSLSGHLEEGSRLKTEEIPGDWSIKELRYLFLDSDSGLWTACLHLPGRSWWNGRLQGPGWSSGWPVHSPAAASMLLKPTRAWLATTLLQLPAASRAGINRLDIKKYAQRYSAPGHT